MDSLIFDYFDKGDVDESVNIIFTKLIDPRISRLSTARSWRSGQILRPRSRVSLVSDQNLAVKLAISSKVGKGFERAFTDPILARGGRV